MDMTGSWLVSEGGVALRGIVRRCLKLLQANGGVGTAHPCTCSGGTSNCAVASPVKVAKRFNVW
jgi:hypothetical protein